MILGHIAGDACPILAYQESQLGAILDRAQRTDFGKHFTNSVQQLLPKEQWERYLRLEDEVHLGFMVLKLQRGSYASMLQFSQDIDALWQQEERINGRDHGRTVAARRTAGFIKQEIARTPAREGFHRLNLSHSGPVNGPVRKVIYPSHLPVAGPNYRDKHFNLPSFVLPLGRLHVRNTTTPAAAANGDGDGDGDPGTPTP